MYSVHTVDTKTSSINGLESLYQPVKFQGHRSKCACTNVITQYTYKYIWCTCTCILRQVNKKFMHNIGIA